MNTTPFLVSYLPLATSPFVYLAGALVAIMLLILFWNWVCAMRDRCIVREKIRQKFIILPVQSRIEIIERYRACDGNTPPADTLDLVFEIAGYAAATNTHKEDILAMLIDWHSSELADAQPITTD